ncbi:hypothetical protein [Tenacibaculum sp. 190524A05c]|uniref:hypothetical protein n=1 Tax=Tenacibaculum platacis TaxID=3137852 RepID=UPI0031FA50C7
MPKIKGFVVGKKTTTVKLKESRIKSVRTDLLMIEAGKSDVTRIQVRPFKFKLIEGIQVKDMIEVEFTASFREVIRKGKTHRFDNNILDNVKKIE